MSVGVWYVVALAFTTPPANSLHLLTSPKMDRSARTTPRILYLLRTGKQNAKRLEAVRNTWASGLPDSNMIILATESSATSLSKFGVNACDCPEPTTSASEGTCCIESSGWGAAFARRKEFDWIVEVDDDAYVHTENMAAALKSRSDEKAIVWGIPGCGKCSEVTGAGLCGGSGYAISPANLQMLVNNNTEPFNVEFMRMASKVGWWADVAFGCVAEAHGLQLKMLPGLYGWKHRNDIEKTNAVMSLNPKPLLFHYQTPEDMHILHEQFSNLTNMLPDEVQFTKQQKSNNSRNTMNSYLEQLDLYIKLQNSLWDKQ